MFCFQCQEASKGVGCTIKGVCGKDPVTSNLQDLLIYTAKGIANIVVKSGLETSELGAVNHEILNSLFATITNANFDEDSIERQIRKLLAVRDELREKAADVSDLHDAAVF